MALPTIGNAATNVGVEISELRRELLKDTAAILEQNDAFLNIFRDIELYTYMTASYLEESITKSMENVANNTLLMIAAINSMSDNVANLDTTATSTLNATLRSSDSAARSNFDSENDKGIFSELKDYMAKQFDSLLDFLKIPESVKKDGASFWENLMKMIIGFKLIGSSIKGKLILFGAQIFAGLMRGLGLGSGGVVTTAVAKLFGRTSLIGGIFRNLKAMIIILKRKIFSFIARQSATLFGSGLTKILKGLSGVLRSGLSIISKVAFGLIKWVIGLPFKWILAIGAFLYGLFDTDSARAMAGKSKGEEVTIWERIRYAASNAVASFIGWFISPETINALGTKLFKIIMSFIDTIWVAIGGPEWYAKMKKKFDDIWTGFIQIIEDVIDFAKSWIPGMESKEQKKINDEKKKQQETKEKLLNEVETSWGVDTSAQKLKAKAASEEVKKLANIIENESTGEGETYSLRKTISDDNIEKLSKDQIAVLIQTKTFSDNKEIEQKLLNAYNRKNSSSVSLPNAGTVDITGAKQYQSLQNPDAKKPTTKEKKIEEATKKPKEETKKENEKPATVVQLHVDQSQQINAQTSYTPSTAYYGYNSID